jgi:hypothetical protein
MKIDRGLWTAAGDVLRRLRLDGFLRPSWAGPGRDLDAALARGLARGGRPHRSPASSWDGPWARPRST